MLRWQVQTGARFKPNKYTVSNIYSRSTLDKKNASAESSPTKQFAREKILFLFLGNFVISLRISKTQNFRFFNYYIPRMHVIVRTLCCTLVFQSYKIKREGNNSTYFAFNIPDTTCSILSSFSSDFIFREWHIYPIRLALRSSKS